MSELPKDEISPSEARRSLALAAAHGIGPFRRRVRLEDSLPYEPEESYASFTIDVPAPDQFALCIRL